ncbi:hypothetical protein H0H81_004728 [Sphagnurus paluster]|uniref:alpha,alpha-trehalase n=1 Tax=Sphagnurus paluster TaxID=117069 RepID=A0A9P7GPA8_9AGAR|nr:hypothetical protein H0H81_004728 [Sphagnurus paluster]
MFEKFSNLNINSAGGGGEYTVQAGFGWTNGVVLWIASFYGDVLAEPQCPNVLQGSTGADSTGGKNAAEPLIRNSSPVVLVVVALTAFSQFLF